MPLRKDEAGFGKDCVDQRRAEHIEGQLVDNKARKRCIDVLVKFGAVSLAGFFEHFRRLPRQIGDSSRDPLRCRNQPLLLENDSLWMAHQEGVQQSRP